MNIDEKKIYDELLKWKEDKITKKPLMVLGVRQYGKTYIIEEFCKNEYNNFCEINLLQRPDIVELFNRQIIWKKNLIC